MFFKKILVLNGYAGQWVAVHTPQWITPNGISWSRLMVGVLMIAALAVSPMLTFALYTYGCVSDWWDGQLARYRGLAGDPYGKRLDEVTDKLLMLCVLPVVAYLGTAPVSSVPFWGIVIIALRDVAVSYLRHRAPDWAKAQPVLYVAKAKTALLMVGSSLLMLGEPVLVLGGGGLVTLATVCALVSGVQYVRSFVYHAR